MNKQVRISLILLLLAFFGPLFSAARPDLDPPLTKSALKRAKQKATRIQQEQEFDAEINAALQEALDAEAKASADAQHENDSKEAELRADQAARALCIAHRPGATPGEQSNAFIKSHATITYINTLLAEIRDKSTALAVLGTGRYLTLLMKDHDTYLEFLARNTMCENDHPTYLEYIKDKRFWEFGAQGLYNKMGRPAYASIVDKGQEIGRVLLEPQKYKDPKQ